MKIPKISLGSWAFSFGPFENNPWSFAEVSKYAAASGYDGIEINGFRPHPHPDDYDTVDKCKELKKELDDLGLGISGYAPDFRHVPPAEVDKNAYVKEISKMLTFCNRMGINILRVDTVSPPDNFDKSEYETRFSKLVKTWNGAAEECSRAGVVLVWEYEPGFWLNKPSEVKRTAEEVGHKNFKLLFDTSHSYLGAVEGSRHTGEKEILPGGLSEYARLIKDFIGHFHLIDSDGTLHGDETSTHTPFGEGYINFAAVLTEMKTVLEKLEWWCVDFCFCPTTEEDGKKAVPFIKNVVEKI